MGLELDLAFLDLDIAFEFQGDQHVVPVYGIDQYHTQRRNDIKKKQICADRGIVLIPIEAIHLEYTKLRGKIISACKRGGLDYRRVIKLHEDTDKKLLRRLNRLSTEYRKTLISSFNSPTARKFKRTRKPIAREYWDRARQQQSA
jgi:hypothetical protein